MLLRKTEDRYARDVRRPRLWGSEETFVPSREPEANLVHMGPAFWQEDREHDLTLSSR